MNDVSVSALSVRGLSKRWDDRPVLENLDMDVARGECVVLIGLSGSGKSSLIRLISGLSPPDAGTVRVDGRLGVVFQEPALFEFDRLTLGENLLLARPGRDPVALLGDVGLEPGLASARPGTLSGGQRRRGALARALAAEPSVLLYDEPTAGLDPPTADLIATLIRRTAVERRLTSLVVTHDYRTAVHVGDRVLILDRSTRSTSEVLGARDCRPGLHQESPEARAVLALLTERVARLDRTGCQGRGAGPTATAPEAARGESPGPDPATGGGNAPSAPPVRPGALQAFEAVGQYCRLAAGVLGVARDGAIPRRIALLAPGAMFQAALGSVAVGIVIALQTAASLARFEAGHLLPEVTTASMVREIIPLLTGLLLAGRIGAAVAAEMGALTLSGQLDALRLLGHRPERYLSAPLVWAGACVVPLATIGGMVAGLGGMWATCVWGLGLKPALLAAGISKGLTVPTLTLALVKAVVFGVGIVIASYRHGTMPKTDPQSVGDSATRGVVEASLVVVVANCLLSQLWFGIS